MRHALIVTTLGCALLAGCTAAEPSSSSGPSPSESSSTSTQSARPGDPSPQPASLTLSDYAPTATSSAPTATSTQAVQPSASSVGELPEHLERGAVVERDGIRARIELQRNPLVAGEPSWVKTTVRNVGSNDVTWFHDGCRTAVGVNGESSVPWPAGREQSGTGLSFKNRVLNVPVTTNTPWPPQLSFVPEDRLGKGTYGCADVGISETIRPGGAVHQTSWWTGFADVREGLPPNGPVTITGNAAHYWRGHREPDSIAEETLGLSLPAWLVGGLDGNRLTPPEIVDAALADPAFVAYLDSQQLGNGREEILWYDPTADVWEVGVMPWYEADPPRIHGVLVDPVTGAIRGTLDRAWDEEVDPFP